MEEELLTVGGLADLITLQPEHVAEERSEQGVVVGDDDPAVVGGGAGGRSGFESHAVRSCSARATAVGGAWGPVLVSKGHGVSG